MEAERSPWVLRLGMGALVLAVLGGIAAVLDRNWAIASYYPIAAIVILAATVGLSGAVGSFGIGVGRFLTVGLVGVNIVLAGLLVFATIMCACSRPLPPPVTPDYLLIHGLHMAGAFGAAALLGAAAILQARQNVRTTGSANRPE